MSALRQLQQTFQAYLLQGDRAILADVASARALGADVRLAIYGDAYFLRLLEVLQKDFPALAALTGDAPFTQLCRDYVRAHPSRHFSVRYLGQHLPAFLRSTQAAHPEFAELAAFEWALVEAFDAADSVPATIAQAAAIAPENWGDMRFIPHPSLRHLDLSWNVPELWRAANGAQPQPPLQAAPHPRAWIVWRQELQTYFRVLSVDEACAIDALVNGACFADLCEGLVEWVAPAQVAVHAAGLLKTWLSEGLIAQIE